MKESLVLVASHLIAGAVGFAGIYVLPILIAPTGPAAAEVQSRAQQAAFTGQFSRYLRGSNVLHRGEGMVSVRVMPPSRSWENSRRARPEA